MKTLYQISADFERVLDLCYDDNITDESIQAELAKIDAELTEKVANGIAVIQQLSATADALDNEIKRLTQNKKTLLKRLDFIKNYYLDNLARIGKYKVQTERGVMSIANAGGLKPLKIDDEDLIPLEFKRQVIQSLIDKDAIRLALERGDQISGARLENRSRYLRIS